ncbi:hypothetical protein NCS57_00144900 [Fusarium keratoplasticum]|uniref:Uncharacterized protein n=1 Tax=Fusarium keratoplasticum TaxID=1328300 RepID=A0ACC0RID6_9HYPO|nr:hypothetical protein NCS57_00144900 [Fusarium keratoplasticum]KAI8684779.1 hypothetical protein NCS57_00144900 [Fusarium keratoplasticum]
MSSPTNSDAGSSAGLVSNFRQAANETSQPGSEVGISRISFCRTYYLDDLEDDPQWMAKLTVHSHELHVLSEFRLRDLRVEDILSAMAFRPRGHRVCYYHAHKPQHGINAIYDNMPLKGWWPWPKEEEAAGETEDDTENEAEV